MRVKLTHPNARLPTRGSAQAAGVDLYAVESAVIQPGDYYMVPTGLEIAVPEGTYLRLAPRSGLALKHGIDVLAGVVDADYRGEIKVILINLGKNSFFINPGDRIAQAIVERIYTPDPIQVDSLDETGRASGGFGSTG